MRPGFYLGVWIGLPLAAAFALGSFLRKARALHPRGCVYSSKVIPESGLDRSSAAVALRLGDSALVRFSSSLSKRPNSRFDILGCAIRFGWREGDPLEARSRDQDLLVSTVRHVFTLPFAPFSTDTSSFLANAFYAIARFNVKEWGTAQFRLVPSVATRLPRLDREAALRALTSRAQGKMCLEIRGESTGQAWCPLLSLELIHEVELDQDALRFNPENAGRGIEPIGFINGLRRFAYLASQQARSRARASTQVRPLNDLEFSPITIGENRLR